MLKKRGWNEAVELHSPVKTAVCYDDKCAACRGFIRLIRCLIGSPAIKLSGDNNNSAIVVTDHNMTGNQKLTGYSGIILLFASVYRMNEILILIPLTSWICSPIYRIFSRFRTILR